MSSGGNAPAEAPEAVVRRVFAALNAGQWSLVAEYADEGRLEEFRRWELRLLRAQVGRLPPTAEELRADLPTQAEAVLDWFMDEEAARLARLRGWPPGLMGVDDVDDLTGVPAAELFVRWLAATYAGAVPWQVPPEPPRLNRRVIGAVRDVRVGELLAHVVYRQEDDPAVGSRVTLTTVRSTPSGWRIDATDTALLLPVHYPR